MSPPAAAWQVAVGACFLPALFSFCVLAKAEAPGPIADKVSAPEEESSECLSMLQDRVRKVINAHLGAPPTLMAANASVKGTSAKPTEEPPASGKKSGKNEAVHPAKKNATKQMVAPGVSLNEEGDLEALLSNLYTEVAIIVFAFLALCFLRRRFPQMYQYRVDNGEAPVPAEKGLPQGFFSWLQPVREMDLDAAHKCAGLDVRMLLEFCDMCKQLCLIIGIPMIVITGPLNWFVGGQPAGNDHLSYISMGNVEDGSWLYYIHATAVWGVVVVSIRTIFNGMRHFLDLRILWLHGMADLRACTILVEGIPLEYQSDAKLKDFFNCPERGDEVESAYLAKDTMHLPRLVRQLREASTQLERCRRDDGPKKIQRSWFGPQEDAVPFWKQRVSELRQQLEIELKEVKALLDQEGSSLYCTRGFVTFKNRSSAEHVLPLSGKYSEDEEEWQLSSPPVPEDVKWGDMCQDPNAELGRALLGYLLVAGLYFVYLPLIIGITNIAYAINLGPALQPYWESIAPTFGLTLMVSLLPSFIKIIFANCFTHVAERWVQHDLQKWYFTFQVVFVLLATAVGQNVTAFTKKVASEPFAVFGYLADTLPTSTHFYLNYLIIQWATHAVNLTRYFQLLKYLIFRSMHYTVPEARERAEPEDQDYYGIGSRSARWTVTMLIPLIYGTLSPPMYLLAWVNFWLQRFNYAYLLCFAESTKADLGGVFYVTKLRHLLKGLIIYVVLMTGVLLHRASNLIPAIVSGSSLAFVIWAIYRFDDKFSWYTLPLKARKIDEEDASYVEMAKKRELSGSYEQPELREAEELLKQIPETSESES